MNFNAREILRDALAIIGTGLLSAGGYLVYEPAGLLIPGVLFVAASVWRA